MRTGAKLRGGCEEDLGRHMERQMGCMTGFFQIFDRHQIYAAKRLASFPSPAASCSSASERSESSISSSCKDLPGRILQQAKPPLVEIPPRPSLPLPVFDVKEGRSSWKFKEAPRLSLDSRVDARSKIHPPRASHSSVESVDNLRRSPSVVARLMGLDALPCNTGTRDSAANIDLDKKAELRRSVSESRVSRDVVQYQFVDDGHNSSPSPQIYPVFENKLREVRRCIVREGKPTSICRQRSQSPSNEFSFLQKKSFFDSQDYFLAEPPKKPVENLESFKQVLEVFHLKGLLHSRHYQHRNQISSYDSPIVVMKSSPRFQSAVIEESPSRSPRNRAKTDRSPSRNIRRSAATDPVSPSSRKQLNPSQSPRSKPRIPCSNTSQLDSEIRSPIPRSKSLDPQRDGRMLLDRCDKLLTSIAEITCDVEQQQQPSPVSVLDAFAAPDLDDDAAFIAEILPRANSYRKSLPLRERLLFDAVKEIAERRKEVPPWESFRSSRSWRAMEVKVRPAEVWTELQRLQELAPGEDRDLYDMIGGVLRKDLEGPFAASAEISDAVLDIERLVFKDLVAEAIRDLAAGSERRRRRVSGAPPRRRLMF